MTRIFILCFFVFISNSVFSQKSEVVFRSLITHNYVIGNDYYVEDNIDTNKLLFMGIIQITVDNLDEFVADAQRVLKTKSKELNGNAYKLKHYVLQGTTLTLLFDVYFASEKQVDLIKRNSIKEKIIVFNNSKDTLQRLIIINNDKQFFAFNKRIEINGAGKEATLTLDSTVNWVNTVALIKEKKHARFFTIKLKDNLTPVIVGGALGGVVGAVIASGAVQKRKNKVQNEFFSSLNYNTGRILMEIYPLDKQITLP